MDEKYGEGIRRDSAMMQKGEGQRGARVSPWARGQPRPPAPCPMLHPTVGGGAPGLAVEQRGHAILEMKDQDPGARGRGGEGCGKITPPPPWGI